MSSSVNRSPDSPETSGAQVPELTSVQNQHLETPTGDASITTDSDESAADSTESALPDTQRHQPIPPPSEPMQYRAIGLIRGQYMPSAEQLTRGTLLGTDGTLIDAVLLGRVMSLVKNHLSLDQSHLWVVYPRTRQEDSNLHAQIVGVWEPEKLNQPSSTHSPEPEEALEEPSETQDPNRSDSSEPEVSPAVNDGYFSIRGEVIYQSQEQQQVVIKIKQSPRRDSEKTKFFKLNLKGFLGDRVVGHFWDVHVQLQASTLQIQEANDIGLMPVKKRPKRTPFRGQRSEGRRNGSSPRPVRQGERPTPAAPPKRREPIPKPIKRSEQHGTNGASGSSS